MDTERTTLFGEILRIIRRDPLILAPAISFFVAIQLLRSHGYHFAQPLTSLSVSHGQLGFLFVTSLVSETVIKPIIVSWTGQILIAGRAFAGVVSIRSLFRTVGHLLASLAVLAVPFGVGSLAIYWVFTKIPAVGMVTAVLGALAALLLIQFVAQFIIFERSTGWGGIMASIRLVSDALGISCLTLATGISCIMLTGMIGSIVASVPVVGGTLESTINAVGSVLFIGIQTIAYFTIRSRYSSVV
ncbi:hypothetical protein EB093_07075 [bacterium]|nr:hypothetical protein [bacterium]